MTGEAESGRMGRALAEIQGADSAPLAVRGEAASLAFLALRGLWLALLIGASIPAAASAQTPPPDALKRYVTAGDFAPGDPGWMAARFDEEGSNAPAARGPLCAIDQGCFEAESRVEESAIAE